MKTKQADSRTAVVNVRKQGFKYYRPMYRLRKVQGVRRRAPLFPFYLLVWIDESVHDWRVLASTRGVAYVLGGDKPSRADASIIKEFWKQTEGNDGYYVDPQQEPPRFNAGQVVRGLRGIFSDKYGKYVGLASNASERVRVLFNMLGREAEFEVRAEDLAAAA